MILCDTGPFVALLDTSDVHHARCVATLGRLANLTLVTTWPCWTEAMHLVKRVAGFQTQDALWEFAARGTVTFHEPGGAAWVRMRDLMRQYQDTPMDLADASLVVAAEQLGVPKIFTLDSHFHAYRIHGRRAFDVIP